MWPGRWARLAVAGIVVAGVASWLAWSPLDANDLVGGDEGYYGTMAKNVLAGPEFLVSPSLSPLGSPGDKPPLYPALLALSIRAFGPGEASLRWLSVASAAIIAIAVAVVLGAVAGPLAAVVGAAFLMTLPWFADASRVVAAEIPLTAFGAVALALVSRGPVLSARSLAAGALIGLAFLCKLWLAVLLAVALAAALWPRAGARVRPLALMLAGAIAVSMLHLVAVAAFQPQFLWHWWSVYVGRSLAERVHGEGYAPYWLQPASYYWNLIAHALGLQMPLLALGIDAALRRFGEPLPRALLVWALGAAVVSGFAVKAGPYAYVVMPGLVALAALGVVALASRHRPSIALLALGFVASSPPLLERLGGQGIPLALWLGVWGASMGGLVLAHRFPRWSAPIAIALACGIAAGGLAREAQRIPLRYHAPGYRAIAEALRPWLENVPAQRPCFVAPEAPALSYYLFRTGLYWGTPITPWGEARRLRVEADSALIAFVVDPGRSLYGGWPDSAMLGWLETSTTEITREIAARAGKPPALRVFVRGTHAKRGSGEVRRLVRSGGRGGAGARAPASATRDQISRQERLMNWSKYLVMLFTIAS